MAKPKVKIRRVDYKGGFISFLKGTLYLFIFVGMCLAIYETINWQRVFNKNYEAAMERINRPLIELPPIVGTTTVAYEDQVWLSNFIKRLRTQRVLTQQVEIGEARDVSLKTDSNWTIKINLNTQVDDVWNAFASVYGTNEIQSAISLGLEYLDLRFGNKIFYKIKTKEVSTTTEASLPATSTDVSIETPIPSAQVAH